MSAFRSAGTGYPVRPVLAAIIAFAVLPPLIFAIIALVNFAESERARAERGLLNSAKGVARAIDGEFETAVAALMALSSSALLQQGDLQAFEQRLRDTKLDRRNGFALFDKTGRPIINTSVVPDVNLSSLATETLKILTPERTTYISGVEKMAASNEPFVFVGVAILRNANIEGMLGTFLFSSDFTAVIREPGVPEDWIVSIVDPRGTHIRRSHFNDKFAGRPLVPELVQHIESGGTGTLRTVSLENIELISTVAFASRSGWAAAVGLPVEFLQAPLRDSLRTLSLVGLAMLAAALALALFIAGVLLRGFASLRTSAEALGRGQLVEQPSSPIREVNEVVNTMRDASQRLLDRTSELNELNNSLERQVADRTAELVDEMAQREESEAQLRQLHKIEAVGNLTGGIAHDFNNMLTVVISGLNLAKRRLARGDDDVEKFIDHAVQGAESAAKLTGRLLAFARQQTLSPEVVNCNKLVVDVSEVLQRTIPENVEIETVAAGGLWQTHIDASGLENAILNLAVNARDAMPEGGKLTIETANAFLDDAYAARHAEVTAGQYVVVSVTDTGSGIAPEILASVFEPFFTTKEPGQGTGLGLSQVYGFIKQSGGHVKIYSECSHGTTVKLYLPRSHDDSAPRDARESSPAMLPTAQNGEKILVVEDDVGVRASTQAMLEELGYTVIEADNGEAALEIVATQPDIVLLFTDVVMPRMNGRELATEVTRRRPDLPILFTTGYTRNAIVHHGILDPDVNLIGKPFTLEMLAQKVAEILAPKTRS